MLGVPDDCLYSGASDTPRESRWERYQAQPELFGERPPGEPEITKSRIMGMRTAGHRDTSLTGGINAARNRRLEGQWANIEDESLGR
jgi:hypothetical protein